MLKGYCLKTKQIKKILKYLFLLLQKIFLKRNLNKKKLSLNEQNL